MRHALVGPEHRDRLRNTLTEVLGLVLPSAPQQTDEDAESDTEAGVGVTDQATDE
jgi:hypothetical protein